MSGTLVSINGIDLYHEVPRDRPTARRAARRHVERRDVFRGDDPRLAEAHHVIAVELQGHGHTADTDRPVTLANFAADVVGLLDHLGIVRADLFGFSLGSLVSIEMPVTCPARVGRLVLASDHIRADGYHVDATALVLVDIAPRIEPDGVDKMHRICSIAAVIR